jgi:TP901 family phage tail tape measure protein
VANNIATQVASLYAVINADLSGLNSGLKSAQSTLQSAGASLARTGGILSATVTAPLLALGKKMVGTAADFESQMNVMALAASRSATPLETLRDAAIAVGGDTRLMGIDALQAADAMTGFYKAGLDTTQILGDLNAYLNDGAELGGALRAAIDMAAASELDLARASDVVAIAMATFQLDASEASRVTDGFVQAADASLANVGQLAEALTNVGPSAHAFGLSLEETNTALAILSNQGIVGAEAGTNLKSMLNNMIRPTKKVKDALKALNVQLFDETGTMRDMPDIIGQLERAYSGLTQQQRLEYTQTIASGYGQKALNALLTVGAEGWADMEEMIDTAATTQASAAARTKGLNAALERLSGSLQTLQIKVGEPLIKNFITPFVDKLVAVADKVLDLDPKILNLGLAFAGAAAVAGPMLLLLGGLATGLGALLSPVGLAASAAIVLGAAFVKSQGGIEGATKALTDWYNGLEDKSVGGIGKALLDELVATAKEIPYRLTWWSYELLAWATSKTTQDKMSDIGIEIGRSLGQGITDFLGLDTTSDEVGLGIAGMLFKAVANISESLLAVGTQIAQGIMQGLVDELGGPSIKEQQFFLEQQANLPPEEQNPAYRRRNDAGGTPAPWLADFWHWLEGYWNPQAHASGTNSAPGGWSLVGERGPELVNLPRGSQVLDANETKAAMGTTVNIAEGAIVIHVNNGNAREVQRGVVGALRQIGMPA